jgi:Fibronectin type III domain
MGWSTRITAVAAVASAAAFLNVAAAPAARLPSAPRSVTAEAGARSVEVTWQGPRSAGAAKIDRYKVVRWAASVPKRDYEVSQRKRSVTLTKLTPGTTYSFMVAAHNERGWGKASKTVKAVPLASGNPSGGGVLGGAGDLGGGGDPGEGGVPGAEDGFGIISGLCDLVAPELGKPTASLFGNRLDFQNDPFDDEDAALLTPGGQGVYSSPSAGGSTLLSEVFAFEVLARCEGASLLKLETEIVYSQMGKTTDLLVAIDGSKVGVSVTRAVGFPPDSPYSTEQASALLASKLAAIQESSQNVAPEDAWVKQILVVMAYSDMHANAIEDAWLGLDEATKADTVLYVVTTDGSDGPLYFDS